MQEQETDDIKIDHCVSNQDNKSAISLEENGRMSIGQRSRHLNIGYLFVTDMIKKGMFEVKYCPTGDMVADFCTKPTQGRVLKNFPKAIQHQE